MMTTMNVSLPETMKLWVENNARSGRYRNTGISQEYQGVSQLDL